MARLDRRDFLKRGLALTSAVALAPLPSFASNSPTTSSGSRPLERRGAARRVVVVGAGLAGLSAAWELDRAGHEVTVLEARTRPGGRVETLRHPFADGLYAEAGALSVYDTHGWTRGYAERLGVALDPLPASELGSLLHVEGHRIELAPGAAIDWPLELHPEERPLTRNELWERYVGPDADAAGEPEAPGWPPPPLADVDRISFAELLRRRGASPGAMALLRLGFPDMVGEGADTVSALNHLREAVYRRRLKQVYVVRGGSDRLPQAFARDLAPRIRYGAPVIEVAHDAGGVRVVYLQAGTAHTLAADRAVLAVPLPLLRRVTFTPPLPADKRRAIEELGSTSVTRTFLQLRERPWLRQGLGGMALTDLDAMMVADRTPLETDGARGLLESFSTGARARRLAALGEGGCVRAVLEQAETLYPGVARSFEGGTFKSWDDDEWARGAYSWFRPEQLTEHGPVIARPEGRLHFAGEHASSTPGWMQGALESGHRAASEVDGAGTLTGRS